MSAANPRSSSTPRGTGEVQKNSHAAEAVDGGGASEGEEQGGTPEGDERGAGKEQEDSSEVEVVEGGKGKSVPVIKPALVYTVQGEVVEVDQRVVNEVDGFRVPENFVRKGSREQSYMYSVGVYVEDRNSINHKYYCMANATCRRSKKSIPCKSGDRSNVNTHLKKKHGLQGTAAVKKDTTKKKTQDRVRELLAVRVVIEKFLPFDFFSTGTTWKELMGTLTAEGTPFPALTSRRVKHLLVEMFVATKKAVIGNMKEEIEKAPLPIIHYGLDLWTCKVSGRKYLDVHVFYVDSNFILRHALIAVKHYAPSAAAQETDKASDILFTIFRSVLAEFDIKLSDLAGGTTDSGSDVEAMCVNILLKRYKILWDLCDCHLADKAAENAFGTSADPQKSKNKEARQVIQLVIKAAAKVNQSNTFTQKFEEAQLEMLNETLKIAKHAPQRWLSLVRVMERIIRLWHALRKVYANDDEEFPLDKDNNKNDILQLYSLLQPLSAIAQDCQYGVVPMTAEMHLAFAELKKDVLDPETPLKVFDIPAAPGSPEAEQAEEEHEGKKDRPPLPHTMVKPGDLRPVTVKTRQELSKALVQRFYSRIWDEETADPSPFRDAAVLLTPSYKGCDFHAALGLTAADAKYLAQGKMGLAPTLDAEVDRKLDGCWADIKSRALEAARKEYSRSPSTGQPALKRPRVLDTTTKKPRFASLGRGGVRGNTADVEGLTSEDKVLVQQLTGELELYQGLFIKPEELDTRDVLPWWRNTGRKMFPCLVPVAQQVLGNQASASQVERDFSGCGNLLVPNRSRMDTYWVEMVMFLYANFAHIPALKDIPMIAAKDIRACLPARFTGVDANLAAAEAAFDVLNNNANSDIGL